MMSHDNRYTTHTRLTATNNRNDGANADAAAAKDSRSAGAKEQGGGGNEKKREARLSKLVISPNLDALLEFEDNLRRMRAAEGGYENGYEGYAPFISSPDSISPQFSPTLSLMSQYSPSSSRFATEKAAVDEGPIGLPPPPRRVKNKAVGGLKRPLSPVVEVVPLSPQRQNLKMSRIENPWINPAPTLDEVFRAHVGDSVTGDRVTAATGDLGESSQQSQKAIRPAGEDEKYKPPPSLDQKENNMLETTTKPRRPLISHAQQPSVSSVDSSSTYSPASTTEDYHPNKRISISSTLYPASSAHSHSHSLYNVPMPHNRSSFIEIYSPTNFTFNQTAHPSDDEPLSPINFASSPVSDDSYATDRRSTSPKPPLPTTPKPIFTRPMLKSRRTSPTSRSPPATRDMSLPPTTNFLDLDERADLIRKTRKLARVFGQTPGAEVMAQQQQQLEHGFSSGSSPYIAGKSRRRGASGFNLTSPRRHSMPLSPDDVSFLSLVSPTFETASFISRSDSPPPEADMAPPPKPRQSRSRHKHSKTVQIRSGSPTSFIDLSDEEAAAAAAAGISSPNADATTPTTNSKPENDESSRGRLSADANPPGSPSKSILEIMSVNDPVEEERKRKRERLAKLHRFLGSKVPAHLVLGIDDIEASLPLPQLTPPASSESESSSSPRRVWLRRRRSSSVVLTPTRWPDDLERVKEDLDDKEKALNVRRAQKMEKVFGVAPPLTMYHTRHCAPAPPPTNGLPPLPISQTAPSSPATSPSSRPLMTIRPTLPSNNSNGARTKSKKNGRPGTSESSKQLLPKGQADGGFGFDHRTTTGQDSYDTSTAHAGPRHTFIYNHYQHSLNSLNDILDRDDRESLAELHQYLNNMEISTPTGDEKELSSSPPLSGYNNANVARPTMERRASIASTIKSERRRSLPARTSMISISSVSSDLSTLLATPKAEVTTFQVRRRRAAKLTQFFGVNYRELVSDVLESIEIGVEQEQKRGTLRAEEVEDLLSKLRNLKTKRNGLV
ncbi:hypothetical protein CPC08DRAFT_95400 [Agrocybe pediades]|nr:hypothetical protein CPC08DRAFT_95400 [Agrocybe pediades]